MGIGTLTDEQKAAIARWVADGADLNQIQDRLRNELGMTLSFMDTRFLIADLGLQLQEKAPTEMTTASILPDPTGESSAETPEPDGFSDDELLDPMSQAADQPPGAGGRGDGGVSVVLDEITIPGALASGRVTFSDGQKATWYLDQMGRLGLGGVERGYQPPESDVVAFQRELQGVLRRAGY
jgi:hypothetical protein